MKNSSLIHLPGYVIIGLFFLGYFYVLLLVRNLGLDFKWHVLYTQALSHSGNLPANPLYYGLSYLFSFCSERPYRLLRATVVLMGLAMMLKYGLTRALLGDAAIFRNRTGQTEIRLALLSAALLVCFSLPLHWNRYYLGQVPPTLWHSPTAILVAPFALGLFLCSARYLENNGRAALLSMAAFILLNALTKPSFLFPFILAFPVMLFGRYGRQRAAMEGMLPVVFAGALVMAQYVLIYHFGFSDFYGTGGGVKIAPFSVWRHFSDTPLLALLFSCAFPLSVALFFPSSLKKTVMGRYAWILFLFSVLIFIVLSETGRREFHGNFMGPAILAGYPLFVVSLRMAMNQEPGWKKTAVLIVFSLHVLSGIIYIVRLLCTGNYI